MKNTAESSKNDLINLIKDIDTKLDRKITLIAIGGTALTLLGIKDSTRDIDLLIPIKKDYDAFKEVLRDMNFKEFNPTKWKTEAGIIIDLFIEDYVVNLQLIESSLDASKTIIELDNITLKTLNLYDIIITKTDRGDPRDFSDIKIILNKEKLDMEKLITRFMKTTKLSAAVNVRRKLLDLIEIKFNEWNMEIDKELIKRVKEWQEN